jgi:hypothetical protein
MKKKIFSAGILGGLIFPMLALAQTNWNINMRGNGWSLGIGSGGGVGMNSYGLPGGSVFNIIENILFWLLAIIGIVSIIGFIIAGLLYLTAGGEQEKIEKAKKALTASIIGVIVGLSGYVVLQAVTYMLSGQTF